MALLADDRSLLLDLLRHTFGSKVELASYRVANRHDDYLVLVVRLAHPSLEVVVKLAGPSAPLPSAFDRTASLHRIVRERSGVPVAEVLMVGVFYAERPWRYMIKEHVPGEEWAAVRDQLEPQELREAYAQIGQAVAELHGIQFPAFGELSAEGEVCPDPSYLEALAGRARRRIRHPHHAEMFVSLLQERAGLFAGVTQACLCHEDLHPYNLIFRREQGRWRLAAILDFDSAWAGCHESDLARLELWRGMVGDGFWEAYEASHPVPERYWQRRPVYQLLWCLEYASATPEHLADTRRVCAQLGLSPEPFVREWQLI